MKYEVTLCHRVNRIICRGKLEVGHTAKSPGGGAGERESGHGRVRCACALTVWSSSDGILENVKFVSKSLIHR